MKLRLMLQVTVMATTTDGAFDSINDHQLPEEYLPLWHATYKLELFIIPLKLIQLSKH
jgi:hypothetical protein